MRYLFMLLILGISINSKAHEALKVEKVIKFDSISKEELYTKALLWVNNSFKNPSKVIQTNEKELGIITIRSYFDFKPEKWVRDMYEAGPVNFLIIIRIKDNKIKITFSNFVHKSNESSNRSLGLITKSEDFPKKIALAQKRYDSIWREIKEQILVVSNVLIEDLKTKFEKSEDDW